MINPEEFRKISLQAAKDADELVASTEGKKDAITAIALASIQNTSSMYELGAQIIMRQDLILAELKKMNKLADNLDKNYVEDLARQDVERTTKVVEGKP